TALGGVPMTIDFTPFKQAAALLYSGPWVAERYAAVGAFLDQEPADADPTVAGIIRSATKYAAVDVYRALEQLEGLKRQPEEPRPASAAAPGCVEIAVVGAHLSGQPLNSQLTDRGARLVKECRTSDEYQLFALPNTSPMKPGLVRSPGFRGAGIELEIWAMPE